MDTEAHQWSSPVSKQPLARISEQSYIGESLEDINGVQRSKPAILNGKYGCALLVKCCGCPQLQCLSLGRTIAMINLALKTGFLRHIKTSLVLGDSGIPLQLPDKARRDHHIRQLRKEIVDLFLFNFNTGLMLSQLPLVLFKRTGHYIDLQEVGYLKLLDFLRDMGDALAIDKAS